MHDAVHRSYLYVVAHRADHIDKAYHSAADCVVLELEDAVAEPMKQEARDTARRVLGGARPKPTLVRINPPGSPHARADLAAVAAGRPDGIRVPKVEDPAEIAGIAQVLDELGCDAPLHLLLESALAVERVGELASASPRVRGVSLGEQDLGAQLGVSDDEGFAYVRSRVVLDCAAAGIAPPVQSVWTDLSDPDGLAASCALGRRLGFVGRSAIHPSQLDAINRAWTPGEDEIAAARAVVDGLADAEQDGVAGLRLDDGRFVDPAVARRARRTLALAEEHR